MLSCIVLLRANCRPRKSAPEHDCSPTLPLDRPQGSPGHRLFVPTLCSSARCSLRSFSCSIRCVLFAFFPLFARLLSALFSLRSALLCALLPTVGRALSLLLLGSSAHSLLHSLSALYFSALLPSLCVALPCAFCITLCPGVFDCFGHCSFCPL